MSYLNFEYAKTVTYDCGKCGKWYWPKNKKQFVLSFVGCKVGLICEIIQKALPQHVHWVIAL